MRRSWVVRALCVAGAVAWGASPASADPDANLSVSYNEEASNLMCPSPTVCFDVCSEKNITHIFVDVTPGDKCIGTPSFSVTVDGEPVTELHTQGGPCNHGDDEIQRIAWFPLEGNQDYALVCVSVNGEVAPGTVSVGAKSSDECVADTVETCCTCKSCPDAKWPWPY